ncbi:MAG: guanine deaminase [Proteobacteria bacterium]|nr:guanine deaminase [Pseudomonadota bacterium]
MDGTIAYRSGILHFLSEPSSNTDEKSYEYYPDGILIVENGKIKAVGPAEQLLPQVLSSMPVYAYHNHLITPGLIDCHVHYPQLEAIASYGEQLLPWLEKYIYPVEQKFSDFHYASDMAEFFVNELLRHGTTSALVFSTVHIESVNALFDRALQKNMRLISGKVLSDQHIPEALKNTPEKAYAESKGLIEKWAGEGRLGYAVCPRFIPSCSESLWQVSKRLMEEYPDIHMHTHLCENKAEVEWYQKLFPKSKNAVDILEKLGALGSRSIFAHGVHLNSDELQQLSKTQSKLVFCPSSNLFLGSGLFPYKQAQKAKIDIGLGSDIGAGTSFSLLDNLCDGYKILQLQNETLSPLEAFYTATLGGAKVLNSDKYIGNFLPGKEADFVIWDTSKVPLLNHRYQQTETINDKLFLLMMLGDDRIVKQTYLCGDLVFNRLA